VTRRPERVDYDLAHGELRALLRGWDPIGVFQDEDPEQHAPEDEYDCLVPRLYGRLRAGEREPEILAFLEHELVEHFGLRPRREADRQFAGYVVGWWADRTQRQSEE
jgi:hypothetical protein